MKCRECEHFKVVAQPLRAKGICFDMGTARCYKHDLVVDFYTEAKLDKLECVEGGELWKKLAYKKTQTN